MLNKIIVPKGKELHDSRGLYKYVGPTVVLHHRGLKLGPTFTDGTPWEYVGPRGESAIAASKNVIKEEVLEEVTDVKEVEDVSLDSEESLEDSENTPKKRGRKSKQKSDDTIETEISEPTDI